MDICRIVYVSRRSPVMREGEIGDIIDSSRAQNATRGVTGVLLTGGGQYLQVLEGNPDEISPLFEKIRGDARHTEVRKILDKPTDTRLFPDWAMKLVEIPKADPLFDRENIQTTLMHLRLSERGEQSRWILSFLKELRASDMLNAA